MRVRPARARPGRGLPSWAGLRGAALVVLAAAALLPASCARGRRPVYPVHGTLLYDGKPVPGAQVILHPVNDTADDKDYPIRPAGEVGADGTFRLTTYTAEDGAPEGSYAVTVSLLKKPANLEGDYSRNVLPARYADARSTPLRAEITRGTNELQPIQISRR